MRNLLLLLGITILLALGGLFFINKNNGNGLGKADTYTMLNGIPNSASAIIQTSSVDNVTSSFSSAKHGGLIANSGLYKRWVKHAYIIDTLLAEQKSKSGVMVSGIHLTASKKYDFLTVLADTKINIDNWPQCGNSTIFMGKDVHCIGVNDNKMYYAKSGDKLVFSETAFLVEDALKKIAETASFTNKNVFKRLGKTNSDADLSIYVNAEKLPMLLPLALNNEELNNLNAIATSFDWARIDITNQAGNMLLKGNLLASKDKRLNKIIANSPMAIEKSLQTKLPFINTITLPSWGKHIDDVKEADSQGLLSYFEGLQSNSYYKTLPEVFSGAVQLAEVVIVPNVNAEKLATDFGELSALIEAPNQINAAALVNNLFNTRYNETEYLHYAIANENLVLSQKEGSVAQIVEVVKQAVEDVSETEKQGKTLLFRPKPISSFLHKAVRYSAMEKTDLELWIEDLKELKISIAPGTGTVAFSGYLQFTTPAVEAPLVAVNTPVSVSNEPTNIVMWSHTFGKKIIGKTHIIKNHRTNTNAVVVQTEDNTLHVLDNSGAVLWQYKLDGKILGDVKQVDYYKNGKLQIVCSTAQKIYTIDILGRDVANYPLQLPKAANAGMTVVDYDGSKNYRYFVPAKGGGVYGFEYSGKPLKGWSPNNNTGELVMPMSYAKIGGKDVLLAVAKGGKIEFLNRVGNVQKSITTKAKLKTPFFFDKSSKQWIAETTNGKGLTIDSKGKVNIESGFNMPANNYDVLEYNGNNRTIKMKITANKLEARG